MSGQNKTKYCDQIIVAPTLRSIIQLIKKAQIKELGTAATVSGEGNVMNRCSVTTETFCLCY